MQHLTEEHVYPKQNSGNTGKKRTAFLRDGISKDCNQKICVCLKDALFKACLDEALPCSGWRCMPKQGVVIDEDTYGFSYPDRFMNSSIISVVFFSPIRIFTRQGRTRLLFNPNYG